MVRTGCSAAWLARLVRDQEVVGSNPATPKKLLLNIPLVTSLRLTEFNRSVTVGNGAINLAGLLFSLAALVHLGRLFCPFQVSIGHFVIPEWWSYIGFFVFGMLGLLLFRSRHQPVKEQQQR
jgi:hypothetical protein